MRRIHTPSLFIGDITLEPAEAHHARDVLRLAPGTSVEIFDDAGRLAEGVLLESGGTMSVRVEHLSEPAGSRARIVVASAVPKGDRADWMVEKLSELGVDQFVPLVTARAVVVPAGKNKIDRWNRLAVESAKQSRRAGVMQIAPMTEVTDAVRSVRAGLFFSTERDAPSIKSVMGKIQSTDLHLFIGPEGGWTDDELAGFRAVGLTAVSLGTTILRVETAAIVAAAVVQALLQHD